MNDITRGFKDAVQGLPPHLRALVSEARSVRDMRGAWTLRDGDGTDLTPPPSAVKAASGKRPVSWDAVMRICTEVGAMIGQVESRIAALEGGGAKALHPGYVTKVMAPAKPRYRHRDGAWIASGVTDILDATSRGVAP